MKKIVYPLSRLDILLFFAFLSIPPPHVYAQYLRALPTSVPNAITSEQHKSENAIYNA